MEPAKCLSLFLSHVRCGGEAGGCVDRTVLSELWKSCKNLIVWMKLCSRVLLLFMVIWSLFLVKHYIAHMYTIPSSDHLSQYACSSVINLAA